MGGVFAKKRSCSVISFGPWQSFIKIHGLGSAYAVSKKPKEILKRSKETRRDPRKSEEIQRNLKKPKDRIAEEGSEKKPPKLSVLTAFCLSESFFVFFCFLQFFS